jgi:hypothetical protein
MCEIVNAGKKRWIWISAVVAAAILIILPFIVYLAIKKQKYGFKGTYKIFSLSIFVF